MNNSQTQNNRDLKKALKDSFSWTILTSFLGLSQVWLTIISSYVLINRDYTFSIAVQEGSLLFFIIALVIAITIDYHFTDSLSISKRISGYVFTFFPMIIFGVATFLYATRYLSDNNQLNSDAFATVQYAILLMTVLYSLIAKFVMFFYQESP